MRNDEQGLYRVVVYDDNDNEIGSLVYNGTPQKVVSKAISRTNEYGLFPKRVAVMPVDDLIPQRPVTI